MTNYIQIQWTCNNLEEARKTSQEVIEAGLAACAQIHPIESIFLWKGAMATENEYKVIFKTKQSHFEKIKNMILANATYEIPEILEIKINRGNERYLQWIDEVTN